MASQAKKLLVMKRRKICVSGKALREEVVLERGSGELAGTSKVYLDSCNAVLRVRWYEYVREVLKSWEARKLVHDSWKDGDIARSMVVGQRKYVRIDVWIIIAKQIGKDFHITPYIYCACRAINYVCAPLF